MENKKTKYCSWAVVKVKRKEGFVTRWAAFFIVFLIFLAFFVIWFYIFMLNWGAVWVVGNPVLGTFLLCLLMTFLVFVIDLLLESGILRKYLN